LEVFDASRGQTKEEAGREVPELPVREPVLTPQDHIADAKGPIVVATGLDGPRLDLPKDAETVERTCTTLEPSDSRRDRR
jgi:hypothetical protein